MKHALFPITLILASGFLYSATHGSQNWTVRDQETIEKTLPLSGAPMRVVVDNVDGYVHITGSSGSEVRVRAHKTIRAETDSDRDEARKEVSLSFEQKPGSVSVRYEAPWRCDGDRGPCGDHHRRFYNVTYDIDVEAPREARLVISTVNNGDVKVDNAAGAFDVHNVNGGIGMTAISGAGEAVTVNGPVSVQFARNPAEACGFKSVNGPLDVFFQSNFSADLLLKTMNGAVYTDFDVTARAAKLESTEQRNGHFVYHSNRSIEARAGAGGPEHKFETLNGDIRIHRQA